MGERAIIDPSAIRDMVPFAVELGIELLDVAPELVRGRLQWTHERTTTADVMHGGAIMSLADTCGGVCAFLNLPEGANGTATTESKTNFLRAVQGAPPPPPPARFTRGAR